MVPSELGNVQWSCDDNGSMSCPVAGGAGDIDVIITGFPVGGLLDFTLVGNVDGSPAQLINTALIELPIDETIEDPVPENNSATDLDLPNTLFADGFEGIVINVAAPCEATRPSDRAGNRGALIARASIGAVNCG